jgi:integrase/recombinase XerD
VPVVEFAEKWPVLGRHEVAAGWLRIWTDLGRAPRTIDAYARGLAEYLDVCERENVDPATASRAHVAVFVRELTSRPSRRGANVVSIDSGAGLSNATIQQRLVPVRLFYDHLIEEGLRDSNPVGRGKYTPGRKFGGHERGLVPRLVKLPWIPDERQWAAVLRTAADEPVRNRVMLALAYALARFAVVRFVGGRGDGSCRHHATSPSDSTHSTSAARVTRRRRPILTVRSWLDRMRL